MISKFNFFSLINVNENDLLVNNFVNREVNIDFQLPKKITKELQYFKRFYPFYRRHGM